MPGLVVFDWNGTVIDDTPFALEEANAVIARYGGRELTLDEFRSEVFSPRIDFYIARGCNPSMKNEIDEVARFSHQVLHDRSIEVPLRQGVRELLALLVSEQVPTIILSNHVQPKILEQLVSFGLSDSFAAVLANGGSSDYYRGTAKGPRLERYLQVNPSERDRVVLLGDTVEEVEIARGLGAIAIAVQGGIHSRDRLEKARPDLLVQELDETLPFFRELFR